MHNSPAAPEAMRAASDEIKVNSDGTAKATGIVVENNHGCEVDASCYLRLGVSDREIRVLYSIGEASSHGDNQAYHQGWAVRRDAHVEVYGRYDKDSTTIETYSSNTFYIHVLSN